MTMLLQTQINYPNSITIQPSIMDLFSLILSMCMAQKMNPIFSSMIDRYYCPLLLLFILEIVLIILLLAI